MLCVYAHKMTILVSMKLLKWRFQCWCFNRYFISYTGVMNLFALWDIA